MTTEKVKKAPRFTSTFSATMAIAWRLQTAKRLETREKQMQAILAMLANGDQLHG
jgi:hypothetical protein